MSDMLFGKRLLIIGGADQHCKIVEAAHSLGVKTYVVDNVINSPAKLISDQYAEIDVFDADGLIEYCKKENIDGAIAAWLDPCQLPYLQLCESMGFHCYGSRRAFEVMTDKELFKKCCIENGVQTIPFECGLPAELEGVGERLGFPLFVKPVDSRGSRGQGVCSDSERLACLLDIASSESRDGRVLVEEYMGDAEDISVTYFFADGHAYLERLSDRMLGSSDEGLGNVAVGCVSPSLHLPDYLEKAHDKVVGMLLGIGCANGPAFMQGFAKNGQFYFYDPGLRFPGGDYERALAMASGIDFARLMVVFALTGSIPEDGLLELSDSLFLGGNIEVIYDITLKSGRIASFDGLDQIGRMPEIVSINRRYDKGDVIPESADVRRRFAEINYLANGAEDALRIAKSIDASISVRSSSGDMRICPAVERVAAWSARSASAYRGESAQI